MKKILVALLVLALGIPALANVDVTWTDMGGGHLQIKVAPTSGASVRGVALKLTRTAGDATISGTDKATATQFNTNIDYAFSHSATYDIGQGHPLAKPDQAGELTAFPASTFSLCSGYLDQSGGKAGVVVDSFFDVFYDLTTNSTITIELDSLRGGIVGDTLGTVTVASPATLNAPPLGYTLTASSTDGGNVTTPGEGAFGPYTGSVAIVAGAADAGYYWNGWTGTGVTAGKVAAPGSQSTSITMDNNYTVIANYQAETVSQPTVAKTTAAPAIAGKVNGGREETFVASGALSSLGHGLEYQFTWGDTTVGPWGSDTQKHTYTYAAAATYNVTVQARCATHTSIVSAMSAAIAEATEAVKSSATFYAAWAQFSRPNCWAFKRNCRGDADGVLNPADKSGTPPAHWVGTPDLGILTSAWKKADAQLTSTTICADFDRIKNPADKSGTPPAHWVGTPDLGILTASWKKAEALTPVCPQDNYWYWTN
jgi:hypothetical protein